MLALTLASGIAQAETYKGQPLTAEQAAAWHRLLHYEPAHTDSGYESQVDDVDFFTSVTGKTEPQAELAATVDAFYQPIENPDQHPICRYPARWLFLSDSFDLPPPPLRFDECPELSSWLTELNGHSVTLVFASSYLNSPSSMFGHTLLRIDPDNIEEGSTWLSYAANFGAEINDGDNSILYAYRGLFGGYPGFFSVIRYHKKIKEYNRLENRDLWEYNLNLTPEETRRLILHLWELRNIDFDYYFFDENCSYRLLELLEVARPGVSLREGFGIRAIPVDTVRAVIDADLVASVFYRPSAASGLEYRINGMSDSQQITAWRLGRGEIALNDPAITELAPEQQAQVVALAYYYLRFSQSSAQRDEKSAAYSLELLKTLSRLPAKKETPPTPDMSPDLGHQSMLVGVTGGALEDTDFIDLRLRFSYHDLADNPAGYLDGAAINIGELQLRKLQDESTQIDLLNFVDINSHSPRSRFFDPITWRVTAGLERVYGDAGDDLVARVEGGAGVTYAPTGSWLVYTLVFTRSEYNELLSDNWTLGAGLLAGTLIYSPLGSTQIETATLQFSDGLERHQSRLIHNLPLGINNAIRFSATHQQLLGTTTDEFSLEFRHFF